MKLVLGDLYGVEVREDGGRGENSMYVAHMTLQATCWSRPSRGGARWHAALRQISDLHAKAVRRTESEQGLNEG